MIKASLDFKNKNFEIKEPIDWTKLGVISGFTVSVLTLLGLGFSVITFLYQTTKDYKELYQQESLKTEDLIKKQSVLEGKLEILISNKENQKHYK